ncbi:MAG: phospho-N-acetylmuramoyl-pentapeptide-transferase [Ruminococcaceae bacterium]|nr:phospho-N-acetylmuramoyl-pentapeptide-transferase [Oscillospiraceae bacterium]MBQ9691574.1 phospho-N-acetylmuramoyl-pentapeptide-transferase [Clostridia bacterium]
MNGENAGMVMPYFFCFIISFAMTALILKVLIPVLKSKKMGQKILDIGPRWHRDKEGTPTMGGIAFILTVTTVTCFFVFALPLDGQMRYAALFTVGYAFLSGLIGVTDDLRKLMKKQNEGLKAHEKFLLQLAVSCVYLILLSKLGVASTVIYIPFVKTSMDIGFLYYIVALVFLVGFSNAVNLTDGLDGLCTGVTLMVSVFFAVFASHTENEALRLIAIAVLGGGSGFLLYNFHPAKVFMGDTGSLFLGAAVCGMAFLSFEPLILFTVGVVYLIEAVSVILQVLYFKISGKRLFLMAPYHHHLERKGFKEVSITVIAVAVTALFSALTYYYA